MNLDHLSGTARLVALITCKCTVFTFPFKRDRLSYEERSAASGEGVKKIRSTQIRNIEHGMSGPTVVGVQFPCGEILRTDFAKLA